ncbi:MAG: ferritin family protein [Bacillota bacterium]
MNKSYSILEVTRMAINIEMQGVEYYKKAAEISSSESIKAVFNILSEQEKSHAAMFTNLYDVLKDIGKANDDYLFDDTVSRYFEALTEEQVFKSHELQKAIDIKTPKEAVEEGLKAEKNSILFYHEIMKHMDSEEVKGILQLIIDEEKKHIVDLTVLAKTL